jgi:hypothetical protein
LTVRKKKVKYVSAIEALRIADSNARGAAVGSLFQERLTQSERYYGQNVVVSSVSRYQAAIHAAMENREEILEMIDDANQRRRYQELPRLKREANKLSAKIKRLRKKERDEVPLSVRDHTPGYAPRVEHIIAPTTSPEQPEDFVLDRSPLLWFYQ